MTTIANINTNANTILHIQYKSTNHHSKALSDLNVVMCSDMEQAMGRFTERYDLLYPGLRMEIVSRVLEEIIGGGFILLYSFTNKQDSQWCWAMLDAFAKRVMAAMAEEIDEFHPDEVLEEIQNIFNEEINEFVYSDLCNSTTVSFES